MATVHFLLAALPYRLAHGESIPDCSTSVNGAGIRIPTPVNRSALGSFSLGWALRKPRRKSWSRSNTMKLRRGVRSNRLPNSRPSLTFSTGTDRSSSFRAAPAPVFVRGPARRKAPPTSRTSNPATDQDWCARGCPRPRRLRFCGWPTFPKTPAAGSTGSGGPSSSQGCC